MTLPPSVTGLWDSGETPVGEVRGRDLPLLGFVHNPQDLLELLDIYLKELQEEVGR